MDYGTDILLKDDDVMFTPAGDLAVVFGPACVAQDIDQTLKITPGVLAWDEDAGSTMLLMLNDAGSASASVIAELERVAIADPRVDPASVQAVEVSRGKFRLSFRTEADIAPEVLEYDLRKAPGYE